MVKSPFPLWLQLFVTHVSLEFKMCYKYCKYSKDCDSKYLFGHVSKSKA